MLFNSSIFFQFLGVTFLLYYLPWNRSFQVVLLTLASFVFYAYQKPVLLLLLLLSIGINAGASYGIVQADRIGKRKLYAVLGVAANLAILFLFKYGPLAARTFGLEHANPGSLGYLLVTLPLPIGISFFTFQGISLVVDVFKGADAEIVRVAHVNIYRHIRDTAFFKAFFPQLVAGPIVKAHEFYPQIGVKRFSDIDWEPAFQAIVMGYFLKMVVADNLKDVTFWIAFPYYQSLSSFTLLALLFGYSVQIFADFAGYSLIAIGIAALFGYKLPQNFNFPYISKSLSEFWKRWHISLSSWLREYLYFPLGGNRKGAFRTYFNLIIVMVLGGLWHGAAWSYAIWGLYHGLGLAVERFFARSPQKTAEDGGGFIRQLLVFAFVTLGWLLFKLPEFPQVLGYCAAVKANIWMKNDIAKLSYVALYSLPIVAWHLWYLAKKTKNVFLAPQWSAAAYGVCLFAICTNSGSPGSFIYFQF